MEAFYSIKLCVYKEIYLKKKYNLIVNVIYGNETICVENKGFLILPFFVFGLKPSSAKN